MKDFIYYKELGLAELKFKCKVEVTRLPILDAMSVSLSSFVEDASLDGLYEKIVTKGKKEFSFILACDPNNSQENNFNSV